MMDFEKWLKQRVEESSDMKELILELYYAMGLNVEFLVSVSLVSEGKEVTRHISRIGSVEIKKGNCFFIRWGGESVFDTSHHVDFDG